MKLKRRRPVRSYGTHLGDFRLEPRVLGIAAMAIPVGAAAALAADGLLKLSESSRISFSISVSRPRSWLPGHNITRGGSYFSHRSPAA
ncbi:hypothetical protein ABIA39_001559 [Nocardia sp. GAS34]